MSHFFPVKTFAKLDGEFVEDFFHTKEFRLEVQQLFEHIGFIQDCEHGEENHSQNWVQHYKHLSYTTYATAELDLDNVLEHIKLHFTHLATPVLIWKEFYEECPVEDGYERVFITKKTKPIIVRFKTEMYVSEV